MKQEHVSSIPSLTAQICVDKIVLYSGDLRIIRTTKSGAYPGFLERMWRAKLAAGVRGQEKQSITYWQYISTNLY